MFKGGTLLTRSHLNYHRISEDLDFTYIENKKLNSLAAKQREKIISQFTAQLVKDINKICQKFGFDFSTNKTDKKYCSVMDRKGVYLFRVYYRPVYGTEEFIKFEVNFNDELVYPALFEDIKHLFDEDLIKDLEFVEGIKLRIRKNIFCYDLREVATEKMRAILTRPTIKERDMFDLFLISKIIDIDKISKEEIIKKIVSAKSFVKELAAKIQNNLETLTKGGHNIIEEKSKLTLVKIKEKEYSDFEKKIVPLLVDIGKHAILKLTDR